MSKYFKFGKYKGKPVDWVKIRDPKYYRWSIMSAPNLIVDSEETKAQQFFKYREMRPNLNFDNEERWVPPVD